MSWQVHSMPSMGMVGVNFFAWHRQLLKRFEDRLATIDPSVTLPYWDWIKDPAIPVALTPNALLQQWGVTRSFDPSLLPIAADVSAAMIRTDFTPFQTALEGNAHDKVHNAVGGVMATASSPTDPLFFLHHANIDRLWAKWEAANPGKNPPNMTTTLKPSPLFGMKVSSVVDIASLNYTYA